MSGAHVLHVLVPGDLATRTGGYEYDRRIIDGLCARGWTVHVVAVNGAYPFPDQAAVDAAARTLSDLPDRALVLCDGLAFGALPGAVQAQASRLRFVALVHHPLWQETGLTDEAADALQASERQALAAARGVVVTSPRTVAAVAALGVGAGRVSVVEPGTDAAPAATGTGPGCHELVSVASVVPRKGHDTLVEALRGLADRPWHLTCVGSLERDVAWAGSIRRQVTAYGLEPRVTFAGELEGQALEAAYCAADLFVLPTRYEGYGMAVAEALARGIPVLSTDTGAIPDLVGDTAGVLVPAGDVAALAGELRRLLADPGDYARLKRGAMAVRGRVRGWDLAAREMEEALQRLGAA